MINIVPKSGAELHKILLRVVMHAPMHFFSTVDTGVTLNRFSQDMTLVDAVLPSVAFGTFLCTCHGNVANDGTLTIIIAVIQCVAQVIFIALGSSFMAICIPVIIVVLYIIQKIYLRTSRQLRFLDLEAKSPLFTHFVETIEGLSSIRAFHWQADVISTNLRWLDQSQKPYYLLFCIQRWLILVLDLMVAATATILMAMAFSLRSTTSGGSLGVALTAILSFSQGLQSLMASWTQMETSLGAIARTKNLEGAVPPEDANDNEVRRPPSSWPREGSIEFRHVYASYE
jgi:ATP-binding cassette subfamily C (CFTR/MRP) protein 1